MPGKPRLRRKVIKIKRDWSCCRGGDDRLDIGNEPLVRHALVIKRRQEERSGKPELGSMPCQRDRIPDRGGAGADHEAIERQARFAVSGHETLALCARERGRLAGGAQHVQPVAAVGEQKTRECHRAGTIRFPFLVQRGCNGGDHAAKLLAHMGSCGHPLTLKAASAAILTSWASLAESGTICTDRSSPTRIGPMTVAPPSSCSSL